MTDDGKAQTPREVATVELIKAAFAVGTLAACLLWQNDPHFFDQKVLPWFRKVTARRPDPHRIALAQVQKEISLMEHTE